MPPQAGGGARAEAPASSETVAELERMELPHAAARLTARLEHPSVGARTTRRAMLAIDANQTQEERDAGRTIEHNGRGWDQRTAQAAQPLLSAIAAGVPFTEEQLERARTIVANHATQVVSSPRLAYVWGLSDDESDSDEDGDFAPRSVGFDATCASHPALRALRPSEFEALVALRGVGPVHAGDPDTLVERIMEMLDVKELCAHVLLSQLGTPGRNVGARIKVLSESFFEFEDAVVVASAAAGGVTPCSPRLVARFGDGRTRALTPTQMCWNYVVRARSS